MKHKVEKEPEGGSKKRKEVGHDNSLASMFAEQQAVQCLEQSKRRIQYTVSRGKRNGVERSSVTPECLSRMYRMCLWLFSFCVQQYKN